jgi:hypothetical protein
MLGDLLDCVAIFVPITQWYCRFYSGRRCSNDARQIGCWMGVAGKKGQFRLTKMDIAATTSLPPSPLPPPNVYLVDCAEDKEDFASNIPIDAVNE